MDFDLEYHIYNSPLIKSKSVWQKNKKILFLLINNEKLYIGPFNLLKVLTIKEKSIELIKFNIEHIKFITYFKCTKYEKFFEKSKDEYYMIECENICYNFDDYYLDYNIVNSEIKTKYINEKIYQVLKNSSFKDNNKTIDIFIACFICNIKCKISDCVTYNSTLYLINYFSLITNIYNKKIFLISDTNIYNFLYLSENYYNYFEIRWKIYEKEYSNEFKLLYNCLDIYNQKNISTTNNIVPKDILINLVI